MVYLSEEGVCVDHRVRTPKFRLGLWTGGFTGSPYVSVVPGVRPDPASLPHPCPRVKSPPPPSHYTRVRRFCVVCRCLCSAGVCGRLCVSSGVYAGRGVTTGPSGRVRTCRRTPRPKESRGLSFVLDHPQTPGLRSGSWGVTRVPVRPVGRRRQVFVGRK